MSEINKTSQQSLQRILDKIGVKSANEKQAETNKSTLGQEDFLKLMTTQLQNQDPFAPMENGDFIAQMAHFSTVTGITEMSNNMKALNDKIDSFRILKKLRLDILTFLLNKRINFNFKQKKSRPEINSGCDYYLTN